MAAAPRQNSLVAGQLFALRNAVGHLRNAYNGLDVEWNDVGKWLVNDLKKKFTLKMY